MTNTPGEYTQGEGVRFKLGNGKQLLGNFSWEMKNEF
jgi:hypothetical protein|nr:MAG TPA_asm: hypothetical protein [Caudoviricetes sp.]